MMPKSTLVHFFLLLCLLLVVLLALYNDLLFPLHFAASSTDAKWLAVELITSQQLAANESIGRYLAENEETLYVLLNAGVGFIFGFSLLRAVIGGLAMLFHKCKRKSALFLVVYLAMSAFWMLVNILRGASIVVDFVTVAVTLLNIFFSVQIAEENQGNDRDGRMLPFV